MNHPYENNDYLKDDKELLKEILFFKKFGLPMEDILPTKDEDEEKEQDV